VDRRTFIAAASVFAFPLGVFAQQPGKVWRIGYFYFASRQSSSDSGRYNAFVQAMRELGYVEGKNLIIEARYADGKRDRLPGLAAELVQLKVDAIVATGSPTYNAMRHANTTIPIIVTLTADPVIEGLAATLARPGGNFTGLTNTAVDLGPKQLELLTSALPQLSRLGVLLNPDNLSHPPQVTKVMLAAQKVGVQVVVAEASTVADIDAAIASLAQQRVDAVILLGDTVFVQQFQQIAQAALAHRIASIYVVHEYAQAGGLMSYGADLVDNFRRAAFYVDKILKGAKPGDLPFERPSRYFLAINLKTAKALGLTIPQSLLLRADEVIQ